ncbi:MAG: 4-hydroxythreonine-4-phosphate dehydrogenase PdxA [Myxococcota bacterium]
MKLGITLGDAAGIGPEVILGALGAPLPHHTSAVVFGRRTILERADALLSEQLKGYTPLAQRFVSMEDASRPVEEGAIGVIDVASGVDDARITFGHMHAEAAHIQLDALHQAMDAAAQGAIAAICTAPWTKALFRGTEHPPVGHTEVLAERFDAPEHVMMLAGARLRVALVTTHLPLADVSRHLSAERLSATVRTTASELRRLFGIDAPRIAVCGLNPHAGEGGIMGREELEVIRPTLDRLRGTLEHVELLGPLPSDTLFARYHGSGAPFDAVVCMYHDQGLIPLKLTHFGESANITLGLPIVRTSVDHGTAYDIAGRGIANADSMRYACELAIKLAQNAKRGARVSPDRTRSCDA